MDGFHYMNIAGLGTCKLHTVANRMQLTFYMPHEMMAHKEDTERVND